MKIVLFVDAVINLILGVLLLIFSDSLIKFVGVPTSATSFYPNILGGVLFGIGLALLVECFRKPDGLIGLGLGGAITINLCGGTVLAFWLLWGNLTIPIHGYIFLWILVIILIGISAVELLTCLRKKYK